MSDLFTEAGRHCLPSLSDALRHRFDAAWSPAVDVSESNLVYTVVMEAPGVDPGDVRVGLVGNMLIITALRNRTGGCSGVVPHRVERHCGSVGRRIALPGAPDPGSIRWQLQHGLLRISIDACGHDR